MTINEARPAPSPRPLRGLRAANRYVLGAGGVLIFLCAALIVVDVLLRWIFAQSWLYSFELTSYAFAIAVAFSLADGVIERIHIRIDILYLHLPLAIRCVVDVLAYSLIAFLSLGLASYAFDVVAGSLQIGSRSNSTLGMPLVLPQSGWMLGLALFATASTIVALRLWLELLRGDWRQIEQIAGAPDSMREPPP